MASALLPTLVKFASHLGDLGWSEDVVQRISILARYAVSCDGTWASERKVSLIPPHSRKALDIYSDSLSKNAPNKALSRRLLTPCAYHICEVSGGADRRFYAQLHHGHPAPPIDRLSPFESHHRDCVPHGATALEDEPKSERCQVPLHSRSVPAHGVLGRGEAVARHVRQADRGELLRGKSESWSVR